MAKRDANLESNAKPIQGNGALTPKTASPTRRMEQPVPIPSVRRLPLYLRLVRDYRASGAELVSCTRLATDLRVDPTQVRKDLALTGVVGRPKAGYRVEDVIAAIEEFLGWNQRIDAVLVGVGSLGTALLGYDFSHYGVRIVAAFDVAPEKVGQVVHGREIYPLGYLTSYVAARAVPMGILTVPAEAAPAVAHMLVAGGVRAIWNFTSAALQLPPHVVVERADFSASLAVLTRALATQAQSASCSVPSKEGP